MLKPGDAVYVLLIDKETVVSGYLGVLFETAFELRIQTPRNGLIGRMYAYKDVAGIQQFPAFHRDFPIERDVNV